MSKRLPLVALLLGLLAACTKAVAGQPVAVPNPTKPKPPLLLVTVLPTGDDPQFTQIKKAVEDYAAAHHGTAKTIATSASPDNSAQLAISAIRQHPTVLVMATPNTQKLATLVTTYSTQQFLIVNTCTGKTPPKNVTCTDTRDHEGVYLMGVEAGLLTSTGKVGAVVSSNTIPQLKRYSVPFGRGAAQSHPGATYQEAVVTGSNPFADPTHAGEIAASLGASHVMTSAFLGNPGVFQTAKAQGFGVFGMAPTDCAAGQGTVVDSLVQHLDVEINDALDAIDAGKGGQLRSYGLKENVVSVHGLEPDVAGSQCGIAAHSDVITKVSATKDKIVAGELTVADPAAG